MNSGVALALFLISLAIALGSFIYATYKNVNYAKSPIKISDTLVKNTTLISGGVFVVAFTLVFVFLHIWHNHAATPTDWTWTIIGGILLGAFIYAFIETFILHYYKKDLKPEVDKKCFAICMVSIVGIIVSFFFLTNGFADFINLDRPLAKAIDFQRGLIYPGQSGGHIAFYALFILGGAVLVYFMADHKLYLQYGKHGLLESTFLVAFPAGIIGARLFYVIGNFQKEFAGREWWHVFAFWEGGLTILGGAVMGIIVGVLWYRWRNKGLNVWVALDICAPVILVAQAIGRWGNFFNCEVYGGLVPETYWQWLPKIIYNNMHFTNAGSLTPNGLMQAPLFFIEGIANVLGYCVLAHLFNNRLKKYCELGDVAFGYLIWYGFTRVFMEPLRDPAYNMGSDGYWSWFWSIMFVAIGILLIAANHVIRNFLRKKKEGVSAKVNFKYNLMQLGAVGAGASVLTIVGIVLMATNTFVQTLALNNFNIGVVCLVVGIACYSLLAIPVPLFIKAYKERKDNGTKTS